MGTLIKLIMFNGTATDKQVSPNTAVEPAMANSAWTWVVSEFPIKNFLILCIYSLIILGSLFGNSLLIKTVVSRFVRCNSTDYIIANLAFSDLMLTIINIPITVYDSLTQSWIFGEWMCSIVPFLNSVFVYVSSFSMVTIAVNRYYLVFHSRSNPPSRALRLRPSSPSCLELPKVSECSQVSGTHSRRASSMVLSPDSFQMSTFKGLHMSKRLIGLLLFIWLLAILHSVPFAMYMELVTFSNPKKQTLRRCRFISHPPITELNLTIFAFVTQYSIPLVIAGFAYLRIGIAISRLGARPTSTSLPLTASPSIAQPAQKANRSNSLLAPPSTEIRARPSVESLQMSRQEEVLLHKRRRIQLLALIVFSHVCCWTSFHVYYLLRDFGIIKSNSKLFLVIHAIALSSVCYNPAVYIFLNENFRSEVRKLLTTFQQCRQLKWRRQAHNLGEARCCFADPADPCFGPLNSCPATSFNLATPGPPGEAASFSRAGDIPSVLISNCNQSSCFPGTSTNMGNLRVQL